MADVDAERAVARRVRPDDDVVRVAFVLRDVVVHPVDRHRQIAAAVVPVLAGMTLHQDADHAVLRRPAADVVVEGVAFADLLLELVTGAAGHVHDDRSPIAALLADEDVEHVFGI